MIEINNLTTTLIEEEILKKVAEKVLEFEEGKPSSLPFAVAREGENKENTDLSIALVGQGRIRELNKRYRGKNRVTDVLAFSGNGLPARHPPEAEPMAGGGEIVICLREVKKNARRAGVTFEKELARVLIHGILHLLGYDHEKSEKEAQKMADKENYYRLGISID